MSLERLHGIIHGGSGGGGGGEIEEEPDVVLQEFTRQTSADDEPTTPKAARRRSLPTRASTTSLSSEFSVSVSVTTPSAEETSFQARRKRAAKLKQFFGVDYRDLMGEVLESLEYGLREEGGRGTLRPDEVQVCIRVPLCHFCASVLTGYDAHRNC